MTALRVPAVLVARADPAVRVRLAAVPAARAVPAAVRVLVVLAAPAVRVLAVPGRAR